MQESEVRAVSTGRGPFQDGLGQALVVVGGSTLPLGAGVALGYWAADRELRWAPTVLGMLLGVWAVGCLAVVVGGYVLGPGAGRPKWRKRIATLAGLAAVLALGRVVVHRVARPTPLTQMTERAFDRAFVADRAAFHELDHGMRQALDRIEAQEALWEDPDRVPTPDEEAELLEAWETFLVASYALDGLREFYEGYVGFDLSRRERGRHVRAFLLTFGCELALYEHSTRLGEVLEGNDNVVKFLNDPPPGRVIPQDSVVWAREELGGVTDLSRVVAGERYQVWLAQVHDADAAAVAGGYDDVWAEVRRRAEAVTARGGVSLVRSTLSGDWEPIQADLKRLVFPVQASVAEYMGDTRLRRPGRYLIEEEQYAALRGDLEPGDVLLARKNWYLSNVGLPGFWPHAILYTGDVEALREAFDEDPDVLAWVAEQGREETFTEHLARVYADAWRARLERQAGSDPWVVIEAVSEGVLQHSLGEAGGDYMAALRPNLPSVVKARAIAQAFAYVGRPYDFDFDFATDHALVCTELVWRSYRARNGEPGLEMPLETVAGRRTLPANTFAKVFRDEHGQDTARFSFVAYLEGNEASQAVAVRDEAAFLDTPTRSKWDFTQP